MASESTSPPRDLKVTLQRFSMVSPIEKTERRYMFLSNIDQTVNFNMRQMHFFQANLDYPPEKVVKAMEDTLPKLLVPYDFLAGRLMFNAIKGRFEVDCNSAGIGFAVASSELTLAELGNLLCPNPALEQLTQELHSLQEDHPIFVFQVTSFQCGGFAMSVSYNHILMDGTSILMFLKNLASLAAGKPLAIIPNNDRTLLAARSPPRVTFSHPQLVESSDSKAQLFKEMSEDINFKVFHLSESDVMKLKFRAKLDMEEGEANALKITSFNVVMAHVWRCKVLSGMSEEVDNPDQISRILFAVDVRSRVGPPPLPSSYVGNALITAYGDVKVKEIEERSFSYLVRKCIEGISRVSDEYVRSVVDWHEVHKGFTYGDVLVSSWWKLGLEKVEYPWGKPEYSCPLVHRRKDIILFFPDVDGVNILVALPSSQTGADLQLEDWGPVPPVTGARKYSNSFDPLPLSRLHTRFSMFSGLGVIMVSLLPDLFIAEKEAQSQRTCGRNNARKTWYTTTSFHSPSEYVANCNCITTHCKNYPFDYLLLCFKSLAQFLSIFSHTSYNSSMFATCLLVSSIVADCAPSGSHFWIRHCSQMEKFQQFFYELADSNTLI